MDRLESTRALMRYVLDSEITQLANQQIPVAAYTSTAAGYFASNGSRGGPDTPNNRAHLAAVNRIVAMSGAIRLTRLHLLIFSNQPLPVIAIIGTRDAEHLKDAVAASEIELSPSELR